MTPLSELSADTLGDRMKQYESAADYRLAPDAFFAVRLDGRSFSRFTRRIKAARPFDQDLMDVMEAVCHDLLLGFHFATVYSQSDEITCIPYFFGDNRESYFNLRIQKLCSVLAGFASASFARHLAKKTQDRPEFDTNAITCFDCRVFEVPTKEELLNTLIWRQRDCEKNAKNGFAQSLLSHRSLLNKNSDEQVALAEAATGKLFTDQSEMFRKGIFVKKDLVEHEGWNPVKGVMEKSMRGKAVTFARSLRFSDQELAQVLGKYASAAPALPSNQ